MPKRNERQVRQHQASKFSWRLFIVLIAAHYVCRVLLESRYWVNDDLAHLYFSNGEWTGNTEVNLVFVHPIFGTLVSYAYDIYPNFPWYPSLLLLSIIASFVTLAHFTHKKRFRLALVFISVISVVQFTLLPTFTFSAIVCAGLGLAIVFLHSSKPSAWRYALGLSFFTIGVSIRPESKYIAVAISMPLFLYSWNQILKNKSASKIVRHTILTFVVLGTFHLIQSGSFVCNSGESNNCQEWEIYSKYNYERGQFHGSPNMYVLEEKYATLGWTELDMKLFSSWLYPDSEKFGPETMDRAFDLLAQDGNYRAIKVSEISPKKIFHSAPLVFYFLVFIAFTHGAANILRKRHKFYSLLIPGTTLLAWVFLLLLLSSIRLPQTVVIPSCILCSALIAVGFDQDVKKSKKPALHASREGINLNDSAQSMANNFIIFIVASFLVLFMQGAQAASATSYSRNSIGATSIQNAKEAFGNQPFLIPVNLSDLLLNHDPWDERSTLGNTQMQLMGWPVFSPHNSKRLNESGLNGIFSPFVFNTPEFVSDYVFCGNKQQAQDISKYLIQDYGYQNVARQVSEVEGVCKVWNFAPA